MSSVIPAGFFPTLAQRLEAYLASELADHLAAARQDAEAFLTSSRASLERWIKELAAGELTADEFTSLVRGQAALCKLEALEQAGLAKIRLDHLRTGIIDLILDSVFRLV